ncbi:50S ribosomal protein L16 [Candidatus Gottesmanbacteria bacterium]|nr:50S ribosomal protein L16 [Candidatus Gottesmanbacteria bacterium]MBI5465599.1 50S ribosomal protein L16 [Candidatus Gottesmanbacteria bacterium]
MLVPKRAKFRKQFRGKRRGISLRGASIDFGDYALKALIGGWLTSRQIEAARRALTHFTQKGGRIWIRVFPDKPISKKPAETRMGGGKGDIVDYVAVVKPGRILFEMGGVTREVARRAMKMAAAKLPLKTEFYEKR